MSYMGRNTRKLIFSLWAVTAVIFIIAIFSPKEKVTLLEYLQYQSQPEHIRDIHRYYSQFTTYSDPGNIYLPGNEPKLSSILWDLKWWIATLVMFIVSSLYTARAVKIIDDLKKFKTQ